PCRPAALVELAFATIRSHRQSHRSDASRNAEKDRVFQAVILATAVDFARVADSSSNLLLENWSGGQLDSALRTGRHRAGLPQRFFRTHVSFFPPQFPSHAHCLLSVADFPCRGKSQGFRRSAAKTGEASSWFCGSFALAVETVFALADWRAILALVQPGICVIR